MSRISFMRLQVLVMMVLMLSGCYHRHSVSHDALVHAPYSERQLDSISFSSTHHYTNGYNFVVKADSMVLIRQLPEEVVSQMAIDTMVVRKNTNLVVADIRMIPNDSIDSVWVELADEQAKFGWIHESEMLDKVVPDDPISQFISTFSDTHLLIFLIVISVIACGYLLRRLMRVKAYVVHFHDIDSFYPTLLTLIVSCAAALYASIQMFWPEMWRQFYYHPTLNPFSVPLVLQLFLILVWAMLIVALAVVDDIRHQLPFGDAVLYLCGLAGVCAVDYIVFSLSTLYYIGYILLAVYAWFAVSRYMSSHHVKYICGNCGAELKHKGRCPYCGAENV